MPQPPNAALRRVITFWPLVFNGLGVIVGAGIYVAMGAVIARAGDAAPLSFLLAGIPAVLTGLCYAELAGRYPEASGSVAYVRHAFGSDRLAQLTGGSVHFAHVSTGEALDLIRQAKDAGLNVTCDTAPPYFDLNETAIGEFRTYQKLSPPLRKDEDRRAVIAGLADGTIDAIASDHQPRDTDDTRLPYAVAPPGGAGLATLLGITLAQVHNGNLTLSQAIDLLTARPARLLGAKGGFLAKGAPADLCLFHPDRIWQVEAGKLPGKAQNTPFDGRALEGKVLGTWKAGRRVFGLG